MASMENKTRVALDADFKEYLGEYQIEIVKNSSEYSTTDRIGVKITMGSGLEIKTFSELDALSGTDTKLQLDKLCWRAVAQHWLKDDTADHGEPHKNVFCYHDGSTRGVQNKNLPLPPEISDKEMDIRHRLIFGGEVQ